MLRLSTFVATGLSAFARCQYLPLWATRSTSRIAILLSWRTRHRNRGLALRGALLFHNGLTQDDADWWQTHFPESRWPRSFDIWGSSHQVFHISVVIGAIVHLDGILVAFQWNYENQRCKTVWDVTPVYRPQCSIDSGPVPSHSRPIPPPSKYGGRSALIDMIICYCA
jgi:Predicted membrane protein, hemolysin III homolog